jgi:hypothetical protein
MEIQKCSFVLDHQQKHQVNFKMKLIEIKIIITTIPIFYFFKLKNINIHEYYYRF